MQGWITQVDWTGGRPVSLQKPPRYSCGQEGGFADGTATGTAPLRSQRAQQAQTQPLVTWKKGAAGSNWHTGFGSSSLSEMPRDQTLTQRGGACSIRSRRVSSPAAAAAAAAAACDAARPAAASPAARKTGPLLRGRSGAGPRNGPVIGMARAGPRWAQPAAPPRRCTAAAPCPPRRRARRTRQTQSRCPRRAGRWRG